MASLHKFTREITAFTTNRGMPKASHIKKQCNISKKLRDKSFSLSFFFFSDDID